ncbi:MAG TPA: alanine racemase [Pyrinomonadaceae bacterium]|nr:alanine racemase [Pyrinomonadaceae bacterium]
MTETLRPTWAEINLENLAFNFHSVKSFVGENVQIMAMVKADAYGHSAIQCSQRLQSEGVDWFGVALSEEGIELRRNGITKNILCLGGFWEGQENLLLENDLTPIIFQIEKAALFDKAARDFGMTADVHIKIDTGMGRVGVRFDEVKMFADKFKQFKNLNIEGLMTHFAVADDLSQNNFTEIQIDRFNKVVKIFEANGFSPKYKDLANSPGAIGHKNALGNLIRPGGILYGLGDDILPKEIAKPELKPVLSLHSRIALLKKVPKGETLGYGRAFQTDRDSLIATIPIGYHDGYQRILSNQSQVIINEQFVPVVGRISMDWTLVDVTDLPNVKINDEVILLGKCGDLEITAADLAKMSGTISYEITCGINRRVWRKYVENK